MLARGMRDNPNHVAVFGDDARHRAGRLEVFFKALVSMEEWQALVARDRGGRIVGVMGMARPGECCLSPLSQIHTLSNACADNPETLAALVRWLRAWEERDPQERHWHIGPFAVEAHLRGRGIGSELLRVICAQMDAGSGNAYLETDMDVNVRFCERFGFEVVEEHTVLGATNWFMMRRPVIGSKDGEEEV